MRKRIDIKESFSKEKIRIFEKAKKLIEDYGKDSHVLEACQITPVGGYYFVVASIDELDKDYVGYKGFLTYEQVCERLKKFKKRDSSA